VHARALPLKRMSFSPGGALADRSLDPERLLHRALLKQAETWPDASAVLGGSCALTHGQLGRYATSLAGRLRALRVKPSATVAVVMERGWESVVGTFGVMLSGAAYAPLEVGGRWDGDLARALSDLGADVVVTQPALSGTLDFGRKRRVVVVDRSLDLDPAAAVDDTKVKPAGLACVMSRPGPGGQRRVKITHAQLAAAVRVFTTRTRLDGRDRLVSLDPFDAEAFACCVWAALAAGGTVVLPLGEECDSPARWLELIDDYDVTVWCSAPAAMQRLLLERQSQPAFSLSTLRLATLEGDWMPVRLPGEIERVIPGARVAAFHAELDDRGEAARRLEVLDPVWTSAPYRRPSGQGEAEPAQRFHVLSGGLEDCPPLVPGDLYVGTPARTSMGRPACVRRPNSDEALVRTGYRARRRPDGGIEFAPWLDRKTFAPPPVPPVWWARARA
jgi:non-ribosomal peptide synthetase component F